MSKHDPKLVEEIGHLIDDHVQGRCGDSSPLKTAEAVLSRLAADADEVVLGAVEGFSEEIPGEEVVSPEVISEIARAVINSLLAIGE